MRQRWHGSWIRTRGRTLVQSSREWEKPIRRVCVCVCVCVCARARERAGVCLLHWNFKRARAEPFFRDFTHKAWGSVVWLLSVSLYCSVNSSFRTASRAHPAAPGDSANLSLTGVQPRSKPACPKEFWRSHRRAERQELATCLPFLGGYLFSREKTHLWNHTSLALLQP